MKTLTVEILDARENVVAWCRMSSRLMCDDAMPETGGPLAASLRLPHSPSDLVTLGCQCAAAADAAGLTPRRVWSGLWDIEPPGPAET